MRGRVATKGPAVSYAIPVIFRYCSMVLQFVTFIFVTRRLSVHDTGIYYEVFGLVNTTYFLAGLGLPDGLVKWVSHADATGGAAEVRPLVRRTGWATGGFTIFFAAIGVLICLHRLPPGLTLLTAGWWICYSVVFYGSQALVSLGNTSWGAFYFYPATSIVLFVTSVPYLLFAHNPTIEGTLVATLIGAFACGVAALTSVAMNLKRFAPSLASVSLRPVLRLGIFIGAGRVLQTSLYWIPVWAIGFVGGASSAGPLAIASRLAVATAAVMAAIRFTIRPAIVRNAAQNDWESIALESRQLATIASLLTVAALIGAVTAGPWIIRIIFGSHYGGAAMLLAVLLIGVMGECIGGPVDEILKMTGRAEMVMGTLAGAGVCEAGLVWAVTRYGGIAMAAVQSAVFVGMYAFLLWQVWRRNRVYVGATFVPGHLRSMFRQTDLTSA